MKIHVDPVQGLFVGDERWPFKLDYQTGAASIEIEGRSFQVRTLCWQEKIRLARFAHLGSNFLQQQFLHLCVSAPDSQPLTERQREILTALAGWLNASNDEATSVPLKSSLLSIITIEVCRALGIKPADLDSRDATEVEMLWQSVKADNHSEDEARWGTPPAISPVAEIDDEDSQRATTTRISALSEAALRPRAPANDADDFTRIVIMPDAAQDSTTAKSEQKVDASTHVNEAALSLDSQNESNAGIQPQEKSESSDAKQSQLPPGILFVAYPSDAEAGVQEVAAGTQSQVFEDSKADAQSTASDRISTESVASDQEINSRALIRESARRAPTKKRSINRFRVLPAEAGAPQSSSSMDASSSATLSAVAESNGGSHFSELARQPLITSSAETVAQQFDYRAGGGIKSQESGRGFKLSSLLAQSGSLRATGVRDADQAPQSKFGPEINLALEDALASSRREVDEEAVLPSVDLSRSVERENRRRPINAVERDAWFDELSERLEQAASEMGID